MKRSYSITDRLSFARLRVKLWFMDLAGRYLGWCERCAHPFGVKAENSRTYYPYKGDPYSRDNPNRDVRLCRSCATEHHAYWDERWEEFRNDSL